MHYSAIFSQSNPGGEIRINTRTKAVSVTGSVVGTLVLDIFQVQKLCIAMAC